jgi:hypothetical protein
MTLTAPATPTPAYTYLGEIPIPPNWRATDRTVCRDIIVASRFAAVDWKRLVAATENSGSGCFEIPGLLFPGDVEAFYMDPLRAAGWTLYTVEVSKTDGIDGLFATRKNGLEVGGVAIQFKDERLVGFIAYYLDPAVR